MRQVVLDTETTGLDVRDGHRVIEFACVELESRTRTGRILHHYINPERKVEQAALEVHGIDNDFLSGKPKFVEIAEELFEFISGSELIIHNAAFDLGFLDYEFKQANPDYPEVRSVCDIFDTLEVAREKRPGRRNSLDALANEYGIDLSSRALHGARQDAEILVSVFLALTGGQTTLDFGVVTHFDTPVVHDRPKTQRTKPVEVLVIRADETELALHEQMLDEIDQFSEQGSIWRHLETRKNDKNNNKQ